MQAIRITVLCLCVFTFTASANEEEVAPLTRAQCAKRYALLGLALSAGLVGTRLTPEMAPQHQSVVHEKIGFDKVAKPGTYNKEEPKKPEQP